MGLGHLKKCSKILLTFNPNKDPAQEAAKQQVLSDTGNTSPWLADNQSRDLNNEFWLDVSFQIEKMYADGASAGLLTAVLPNGEKEQSLVVKSANLKSMVAIFPQVTMVTHYTW